MKYLLLLILSGCAPLPAPDLPARAPVTRAAPVGRDPSHTFVLPAQVIRVIDGDTLVADVYVLPGRSFHAEHVRVQHINAPELGTPSGSAARDYARGLLPVGSWVVLSSSRAEKYGRVLASVKLADGRDLGAVMIQTGHAVAYEGQ